MSFETENSVSSVEVEHKNDNSKNNTSIPSFRINNEVQNNGSVNELSTAYLESDGKKAEENNEGSVELKSNISIVANNNDIPSYSRVEDENENGDETLTPKDYISGSDTKSPLVSNQGLDDPTKRRATACNRCHSLKVKCVPSDPTVEYSTCKRCLKKNITCEFNIATKKKKNIAIPNSMKLKIQDNEIQKLKEELQRKDQLIKLLRGFTDEEEERMVSEISSHERLRMYNNEIKELENVSQNSVNSEEFVRNSERRVKICESQMSSLDIIGKNLLTHSQCAKLLNIFVTKIHPRYPLVDLPRNISIDYLRKDEPLLFVIMVYIGTVADLEPSDITIETQLQLECLISKSISQEILLVGNKSIQLLKCTLLYSIWYIPPELFHHRRYHMFSALCVSMAHDLGISGRPFFFYNKDDGSVKKASVVSNGQGIDLKALVLDVYVVYMSISLFLKRIVFLQWTEYLDQSCQILENSNMRCYKMIALYARMNHLMEIIYRNVHKSSEQTTVLELSGSKNKFQLAEYLDLLNKLKERIASGFEPNSSDYNALMAYLYSVQAYIYEPSLQILIGSKEYVSPEYKNVFFSTLTQICESCLLSLKHFNQLTIDEIVSNPLFHTSRILYTSGMLLRIRYLSLTIPKSGKACLFTEECISTIKLLTDKIDETAKKYPKNHFIKKIAIVLGLFIHTCLSQWYISYKTLLNDIKMQTPLFVDPSLRTNILSSANRSDIRNESPTISTTHILPLTDMPTNEDSISIKRRKVDEPTRISTFKPAISTLLQQGEVGVVTPQTQIQNISERFNSNSQRTRSPLFSNNAPSPPTPLLYLGSNNGSAHDANSTHSGSETPLIRFTPNSVAEDNRNFINVTTGGSFSENQLGVLNGTNVKKVNLTNKNTDGSPNDWEFQYKAFNDEFWSDLFFGNGENGDVNVPNIDADALNLGIN